VALVNEAGDPESLRRSLAVVREAGERIESLIAALLASRADRGDYRTEIDLSELVRKLTDETELHGLQLDLALRPARVLGDPELLRTMAANLIENAIRHNSPGGWSQSARDRLMRKHGWRSRTRGQSFQPRRLPI
jgi:signal transduction histidine kinase